MDNATSPAGSHEAPGCYINEISAEPFPSGHASQRRGVGIEQPDGSVTVNPLAWPER
jgi:hypothetical protein